MYIFEDREVTRPLTFKMVQNSDGTVTLEPAPGTVNVEGTPINKKTMEALQKDIYDTLYPIGKVVFMDNANDYSNWLGFNWIRIAQGDAIVGYDENDENAKNIEVEFGSNTKNITHNGSAGATSLTVKQIPPHNHGVNDPGHIHKVGNHGNYDGVTGIGTGVVNGSWDVSTSRVATGISIQNTGSGESHTHTINHTHNINVVQKSIPLAVWKRVS